VKYSRVNGTTQSAYWNHFPIMSQMPNIPPTGNMIPIWKSFIIFLV